MPIPLLLHSRHAGETTAYQLFGSWVVPWRFDSLETEYQALRTGVGLIDYSTQALIEVKGADGVSFLHNVLSNHIKRLSPGHGCQSALLHPNAKLIADLLVLVDASSVWLMCEATRTVTVAQTLERYLFSEQVTLTNHERRDAVLALQGPHTLALLTQLFGSDVALPQLGDHVMKLLQGVSVRLIHHTLTGGPGVVCLVAAEHAHMVWELLKDRGKQLGLVLVGWEALNIARIEAGIPWFGIDMDESNLLPETGLETVLASDTKGCYIGQEIVARLQTYGSANKKLMGLRIESDQVPQTQDMIVRNGEELGRVTSACSSLALKQPIALGYLKRGAYDPGTRVEILHGGARLAATVTARQIVV